MTAQQTTHYFLEIKEGYELGTITKTVNPDQTFTLSMANTALANSLNNKDLTKFEPAFPGLQRPRLTRIYVMEVPFEASIGDLSARQEVENIELVPGEAILLDDNIPTSSVLPSDYLPNDYVDIIIGGRNQELDLIKAPLAWTISTGENILVGVSDANINVNHEDLQGQIIILPNSPTWGTHGTGTAGKIVAKTDNGIGVASLAYNSKVVSLGTGYNQVLQLAQVPGVKVINCSWISCGYSSSLEEMYAALAEEYGVLVVASAGNSSCNGSEGYSYPASYESTLSATSVGSKFPIGYFHDLIDPVGGGRLWADSWKDCHYHRPFFGEGTHTHNDKVDVAAPGILVTTITDVPEYPLGYRLGNGTSGTAPFVSALAALIFSVDPNFTPAEVKDIIKNTADDIYYIPYNQDFFGQLGTGRINAFRAVKTAKCMTDPTPGLNLAMQDSKEDYFEEPNINTEIPWRSEDIFVRNQDDGDLVQVHQNPEYDPSNPNYVYVCVTNNSCEVSSGTDQLKLYWAKANTALSWPNHWDGSFSLEDPITHEDILMGNEVGTLNIPSLEIGETATLEFEWDVPSPDDYENINANPWHFCLLARIESNDDPMTFTEGSFITDNVTNNNNIAWKNTTVVDIVPNGSPVPIGAVVALGNPSAQERSFNFEFVRETSETGKAIYEEAEVSIIMDDIVYDAWDDGGKDSQNMQKIPQQKKFIVMGNHARIENVQFPATTTGTVYVSFNFLTKEQTPKKEYTYHLIQKDAVTDKMIGGETFEIRKQQRERFMADAGDDKEIDRDESITITAAQINEAATYNWYDSEGNLVYTGTELTVSPQVSKQYKLEIISDIDGYKDYDEVEVTVNPYKLQSLVPNPATNQVTATYDAQEAISAYLMVVSTHDGTSNNYIVDTTELSINLDISSYPIGIYTVALVCDGEIQDSKNLIKQ